MKTVKSLIKWTQVVKMGSKLVIDHHGRPGPLDKKLLGCYFINLLIFYNDKYFLDSKKEGVTQKIEG